MSTLYGLSFSHPALAARMMLERAGIEHRWVALPPGLHPLVVRVLGFPGSTVPALRLDGWRIQGSLEISRAIHAIAPEAGLFPADPAARERVEEAEQWGERELQPIPRRLFRWALARDRELRQRLARRSGIPAPSIASRLMKPMVRRLARISSADDATVRADMERLPELLDRVDGWIQNGTIGGPEPNAADYQIGLSVRAMLALDDLRGAIEGRPAADLARRILPDFPGRLPPVLPEAWRPAAR